MQQTIKLGNLTLPRTAGLAPMAGVADRATGSSARNIKLPCWSAK